MDFRGLGACFRSLEQLAGLMDFRWLGACFRSLGQWALLMDFDCWELVAASGQWALLMDFRLLGACAALWDNGHIDGFPIVGSLLPLSGTMGIN